MADFIGCEFWFRRGWQSLLAEAKQKSRHCPRVAVSCSCMTKRSSVALALDWRDSQSRPPASGWLGLSRRIARTLLGMKAFLKVVGTLSVVALALVAVGLYLLLYQSAAKTTLMCDGKWDVDGENLAGQSETVFAEISEFRPWVGWISSDDSQGSIRVESHQSSMLLYAPYLHRIDTEPMRLFRFQTTKDGEMTAAYREAFKELTVQFTPKYVFTGTCKPAP
jgi:hypothetical protein